MGNVEKGSKKDVPVRLPTYFNIVNFTSFISAVFFFLLVLGLPEHSDFVAERRIFLVVMAALSLFDALFLYFALSFAKTRIFLAVYFKSILWIFMLTAILYALGGVRSYFGLIVVFPILAASFDLEPKVTLYLGSLSAILFAAMMFLDSRFAHTPGYYVVGFSHIILLGIFTFYLYSIIKEGVRQRFEKEEARRKYFDLVEVDRAKTEFVTVVSHQLLTPLSELRWAFDHLMETKRWDEAVRDILKKSNQSVNALIGIVRDIIHVSDLEKEKIVYKREKADLARILNGIIAELRDLISAKEVDLEFREEAGKFFVYCDPERLRNALLNIVDNAVKYSPRGKVSIFLAKDQTRIRITVSDTGIGIPVNDQQRIFTKFFRASNAMRVETNASGVGLFIAKSIIERHNGTVDFASELGKGTTFTILLPMAEAEEKSKDERR